MKYDVNEQYSISYGHRNNTNLEQSKHGPLYKKSTCRVLMVVQSTKKKVGKSSV